MPSLPDLPQTEAAIIALTNAFRQEQRLGAVAPNRELEAAARWFAGYLARSGKFAHEADGRKPQQRAAAYGYRYCMVAENLALNLDSRGYTSERLAAEVVEGWKASPGHRRNLVEPDATEIGVAVARAPDRDPKFISVQLFGRPESLKIEFQIRNLATVPVTYTITGESHRIEPRTIVTQGTCSAGQISFDRAGSWLTGVTLGQRFDLQAGRSFALRPADRGAIRIVIEPMRRE
jgi:hypothetical protein